jgi:hypothetical protein
MTHTSVTNLWSISSHGVGMILKSLQIDLDQSMCQEPLPGFPVR